NLGDSSGVSDSLAYECQRLSDSRHTPILFGVVATHHPGSWHTQSPNKTPEPTAIGTFSLFINQGVTSGFSEMIFGNGFKPRCFWFGRQPFSSTSFSNSQSNFSRKISTDSAKFDCHFSSRSMTR